MSTALSRRRLLASASAAALALAAPSRPARAVCRPGGLLSVEEVTFEVAGLDPAHDGLRVAQLSDIHVGATTAPALVREAVDAVNAAAPDLVVLTGDDLVLAKSGTTLMREQLGGLRAPTIAVLGNHDHWVDAPGARSALVAHGYAVLQNASTTLTLRGEPFTVIGVDDLWTRHADAPKAFAGARRGSRLVLAHVPRSAEELSTWDEPLLVLSGHTHGGQIHLPGITAAFSRLVNGDGYERGRYAVGKVQLYVNRGLGTSGVPVRVGSPPELTLATLRRAGEETAANQPRR